MLTITKPFSVPEFPLRLPLAKSLFFDIETTGFSPDTSHMYLIGCVFFQDNTWQYRQWFAENPAEEADIISAFFAFAKDYPCLIHFNGEQFDIPYVTRRIAKLGLSCAFTFTDSIDLLKRVRPYKSLLGLDSCRQKSVERFLHIEREDRFSGGELIQVYKDYVGTSSSAKKEQLLHLLLLHNAEDLCGMPRLLPILNYPALLSGTFTFQSVTEECYTTYQGEKACELILAFTSEYTVPQAFTINKNHWYLSISGNQVRLRLPLIQTTLKYFYPDYKDYYYLPVEDMAIHKSVAAYVDKEFKQKATKKTCYTKKQGIFFPQPEPVITPAFQKEYGEKIYYAEYTPEIISDTKLLEALLTSVLQN